MFSGAKLRIFHILSVHSATFRNVPHMGHLIPLCTPDTHRHPNMRICSSAQIPIKFCGNSGIAPFCVQTYAYTQPRHQNVLCIHLSPQPAFAPDREQIRESIIQHERGTQLCMSEYFSGKLPNRHVPICHPFKRSACFRHVSGTEKVKSGVAGQQAVTEVYPQFCISVRFRIKFYGFARIEHSCHRKW